MNIEKMPRFKVLHNLLQLGLLTEDSTAVSYSVFKNKASIMKINT